MKWTHNKMFTIEIRINGTLVAHIYGRNLNKTPHGDFEYGYEYYSPELPSSVIKGIVCHDRGKGINPLITKILDDVSKKQKHEKEKNIKS